MMLKVFLSCCLLSPLVSALKDPQELKVKPEQDVTLQCRAPRGSSITLVEWNRADLRSDGYLFFYRNERSYENFQHPSFRGRVKLRDPEMKDGDASVVLRNVTVNDTGTYECRIIIINTGRAEAEPAVIKHLINLKVTEPAGNTWSGVNRGGYVGLVVPSAAAAVGFLAVVVCIFCFICKKREQKSFRAPPEEEGEQEA
ncbi:coxsackievirus and adenovirus receptor homolog [Chelmon rostratus]|uniref:coxsackievirus and adenovirus receptor homolog n=1 Tax=Chelmon rostratus TaxID=109905 RepID=UPI001BE65BD7|nr:coxsackievirus and adenovirus receptor homolog [Chelmon rostratus]XP_041821531.1 coxsackievirus and adenovirus receptor homolog [Chelmon rostratus]